MTDEPDSPVSATVPSVDCPAPDTAANSELSDGPGATVAPDSTLADEYPLGGGGKNDLKPASVALLLLLMALGVGAMVVGWENPSTGGNSVVGHASDVDLSPPPWWPSKAEVNSLKVLAETRRTAASKLDRGAASLKPLVEAYYVYNKADVAAAGATNSKALRDAYAAYQARAREFFQFQGEGPFIAVGARLLDDFWRALSTRNVSALTAISGSFVKEAQTIGLLRGEFLPARHAKPLIASAFMLRWVSVLAEIRPLDGLVDRVERIVFLRFKVGAHRALKPERRAALAKLLRRLQPGFPADELLASRFATERRWALCARFYRRALKGREQDKTLRANIEYCASNVRGPKTP